MHNEIESCTLAKSRSLRGVPGLTLQSKGSFRWAVLLHPLNCNNITGQGCIRDAWSIVAVQSLDDVGSNETRGVELSVTSLRVWRCFIVVVFFYSCEYLMHVV